MKGDSGTSLVNASNGRARAIVEANAGGYGMGLAYVRDMIHHV